MIDGGTCQVGLTVMNFIVVEMIGVGMSGLPMTIFVFQIRLPLLHHAAACNPAD